MSTRLSFFKIERLSDTNFQKLQNGINQEKLKPGASSGFIVEKDSSKEITGKYVERYQFEEIIIDPFGKQTIIQRLVYNSVTFQLKSKPPQLLIINSSNALKGFLGRLSEFGDFQISIEPLELNLSNIINSASKVFLRLRVYSASINTLSLTSTASLKLVFDSTDDVRKHAKKFLRAKNPLFDIVKLEFEYSDKIRRSEFKSDGKVCVYGECDPGLLDVMIEIGWKASKL